MEAFPNEVRFLATKMALSHELHVSHNYSTIIIIIVRQMRLSRAPRHHLRPHQTHDNDFFSHFGSALIGIVNIGKLNIYTYICIFFGHLLSVNNLHFHLVCCRTTTIIILLLWATGCWPCVCLCGYWGKNKHIA